MSKVSLLFTILLLLVGFSLLFPTECVNKGMCVNETNARFHLGLIVDIQKYWAQQDCDGNGIQDYWTYDLSCLYRIKDKDKNTIKLIDVKYAKSDTNPAKNDVFGDDYIQKLLVITSVAYSGYYYRAMSYDEDGIPYNQNEAGPNKVKATNSSKWAFVAYPATYGTSGRRTYIINQEGIIYALDCESFVNSIILQWPGKDPTKVKGPGGKYWLNTE